MDYNNFWEMQRCFCYVKEELERIVAPFAAANDVTSGQLRILMALRHEDGQAVNALARGMCMADANMSTQVKRLCEKGLVMRRRHQGDERQVRVSLTEEGERMARAFTTHCNRRLQATMKLATDEEIEAIRQGFVTLEQVVRRRIACHRLNKAAVQPLPSESLHVRVYKENRK